MANTMVSINQLSDAAHPGMVWIPGGTFLMGSDKHYPEEAPAHEVTVDGFWMDYAHGNQRRISQVCRRHEARDIRRARTESR